MWATRVDGGVVHVLGVWFGAARVLEAHRGGGMVAKEEAVCDGSPLTMWVDCRCEVDDLLGDEFANDGLSKEARTRMSYMSEVHGKDRRWWKMVGEGEGAQMISKLSAQVSIVLTGIDCEEVVCTTVCVQDMVSRRQSLGAWQCRIAPRVYFKRPNYC